MLQDPVWRRVAYSSSFPIPPRIGGVGAPYYYGVEVYLRFDNNITVDSSYNDHTVVATTGVANSTERSIPGFGTSARFTGGQLTVGASPRLRLGDAFTFELRIRITFDPVGVQPLVAYNTGGLGIYLTAARGLIVRNEGGATLIATADGLIPLLAFTHIALIKHGTKHLLFVDGAIVGAYTGASSFGALDQFIIGGNYVGDTYYGYMDEFIFTRNSVRYGRAFTPATIPFVNADPTKNSKVGISVAATSILVREMQEYGNDMEGNAVNVSVTATSLWCKDIQEFGSDASGNTIGITITPTSIWHNIPNVAPPTPPAAAPSDKLAVTITATSLWCKDIQEFGSNAQGNAIGVGVTATSLWWRDIQEFGSMPVDAIGVSISATSLYHRNIIQIVEGIPELQADAIGVTIVSTEIWHDTI